MRTAWGRPSTGRTRPLPAGLSLTVHVEVGGYRAEGQLGGRLVGRGRAETRAGAVAALGRDYWGRQRATLEAAVVRHAFGRMRRGRS